jgi:cardiolipin synthase
VLVLFAAFKAAGIDPLLADAGVTGLERARYATFQQLWHQFALLAFISGMLTDFLDGWAARAFRAESRFGVWLDPIADKLLVGAALMLLAGLGRLSHAALYPAIVIMLREIMVSGLREYLAELRIGLPVTRLAKWKTGFQMGALGTLLAGDTGASVIGLGFLPVSLIGETGLWIAAALTLATGWDYLQAGLRHAGQQDAPAAAAPENTAARP